MRPRSRQSTFDDARRYSPGAALCEHFVRIVLFDFPRDLGHHAYRFGRICAARAFAREHDGVGAVENRVRDVRRLRRASAARLVIIDSSICVAVMTGLDARLRARSDLFESRGTSSSGISMPRSPRATMIPSASVDDASISSSASCFSIFAMTRAVLPRSAMKLSRAATSSAERTNETATQSTPLLRPNSRYSKSRR